MNKKDIGYIPGCDNNYGGYQKEYAYIIWMAIQSYIHHLQICHRDGEYLFSHAGISQEWLFGNLLTLPEWNNPEEIDYIIDYINDSFTYKSKIFDFNYFGKRMSYDESGDDPWQGPTWIRPRALKMSNYEHWLKSDFIQIVGHTPQDKIDFEGHSTGGRYYFVDTQDRVPFEYLTIINGELKLNTFYE